MRVGRVSSGPTSVPRSKSTSDHRSAAISPSRAPVEYASQIADTMRGAGPYFSEATSTAQRMPSTEATTWFRFGTLGMVTEVMGDVSIHRHYTPCESAAEIVRPYVTTEDGERPVASHSPMARSRCSAVKSSTGIGPSFSRMPPGRLIL